MLEAKGTLLVKLNPYLDEGALKSNKMKAMEEDFYLEPSGLCLLNKPDDYWIDRFSGFSMKESKAVYYLDPTSGTDCLS